MTQLTIGYSDSEDRLWMRLSDEDCQCWLSRRFCKNLLRAMEQGMTESCPGAELQSSLDAKVRVALEHQTAHESQMVTPAPTNAPKVITAQRSLLLTSAVLTVSPSRLEIELVAPSYSRTLVFNRAEGHQFLAALWQRCISARWDLQPPSWVAKVD